MRFSEVWLREWVDPPIDTDALVDQLSMSGLEVDAVEPAAPAFSGVCIGRVDSVESHPDASKLRVCTVDVGGEEALQIVCGAANVAVGMRVPVATLGARLPGGLAIKRVRLRGVESFGMICSAAELGLAESSDGILALPGSAPLGEDLRAFLQLDDRCIELDLTPDRGDCLSLAGVAREVGVLNRVAVGGPVPAPVPAEIDDRFPIDLRAEAACPRYLCRVVRGIDPSAETPLWMRERLRRSGLRPISAVVDVTNYVLLELGQPMHAFDLARLDEGIEVRMARPAEPLVLLNGESLALREDTLVIADRSRAVALAGIMGGAETAVSEQTRDILLESAFFSPAEISGKARSYGLHTDSSHRFERGVDPGIQALAIERATALLGEIVGGSPGPVVEVTSEAHLPRPQPLLLRRDRLPRVLGIEMHDERVVEILSRLGMAVENHPEGWRVTPPSSRFDLLLEVDLIAEIGRVHGYDRIPATHARSAATTSAPPEMAFELERVCRLLVDRGYHEAITYSFVGPEYQAMIDPATPPLALANPLSAELSVMRTTLWPGLLQAAGQNLARQQSRVRLFESGLRFLPKSMS
jgi:phenylalanyl-tRNA synthetase beta chain